MPKERKKVLCMDAQRHAEYYGIVGGVLEDIFGKELKPWQKSASRAPAP